MTIRGLGTCWVCAAVRLGYAVEKHPTEALIVMFGDCLEHIHNKDDIPNYCLEHRNPLKLMTSIQYTKQIADKINSGQIKEAS